MDICIRGNGGLDIMRTTDCDFCQVEDKSFRQVRVSNQSSARARLINCQGPKRPHDTLHEES